MLRIALEKQASKSSSWLPYWNVPVVATLLVSNQVNVFSPCNNNQSEQNTDR